LWEGSWPYSQVLDEAEKVCRGLMLQFVESVIDKEKSFITLDPGLRARSRKSLCRTAGRCGGQKTAFGTLSITTHGPPLSRIPGLELSCFQVSML
jgi:hypothetical protein